MKWTSAISQEPDLRDALEEAIEAVQDVLGDQVDLLVAFASPHHSERCFDLPEILKSAFPDAIVVGCTGGGIIGAAQEMEDTPAFSLTAARLPDVELIPFHVDAADLDALAANPARWHDFLGVHPDQQPCFILLPEPFSCPAQQLTESLDEAFPDCTKVGGLASGSQQPGGHHLFLNEVCQLEGAVGIALWGDVCMDTVVAQGCRPIGQPMLVSRSDQNVLFELDGRPALPALDEIVRNLNEREQALFSQSPHLGIAINGIQAEHGDFLVRNILGIDRQHNVVAVGAIVETGQTVQFHIRDAETSSEDLHRHLGNYQVRQHRTPPSGALLFSCLGRGRQFYGVPNHDSRTFQSLIGEVPLGGFFCNGEIGPVHGQTQLHGYTSSFGLFRSRGWD
ncbi:MAG: FIST N-terminal domain-containing protein [Myxococcota bacterium]|nr:FIST N-terminal domain-containing protein [Myxococcota bacterium]